MKVNFKKIFINPYTIRLVLMVLIVIAMIIQSVAMGKKRFDFLDNGTEHVVPKRVSASAFADCAGLITGITASAAIITNVSNPKAKSLHFFIWNFLPI